jgi:hypothetical protein
MMGDGGANGRAELTTQLGQKCSNEKLRIALVLTYVSLSGRERLFIRQVREFLRRWNIMVSR